MKTRDEIYSAEAAELLRIITTYHYIRHSQILKFFSGKENKIDNLLSYFTKQGRIFYEPQTDMYSDGSITSPSYELLSAIWVLTDFIDKADYHSPSDFPIMLVFVIESEMYEVIYVADGNEGLINHALSQMEGAADKRLVIVENTNEIERLSIPDVTAYCTVDSDTGRVNYYEQRKEDNIG